MTVERIGVGTYSPICENDLLPLTRHFSRGRLLYFSCEKCGDVVAAVDGRAVRNLREVR